MNAEKDAKLAREAQVQYEVQTHWYVRTVTEVLRYVKIS
jgi:hypothetical protein